MLLLGPAELGRFAPLVASNSLLRSISNKLAFISEATASAEAFCFRSNYGFDIREIFEEDIRLDKSMNGKLSTAPFLGWVEETGELTVFGDSGSSSLVLADFSVESSNKIALIRNLSSSPSKAVNDGFSESMNFNSVYQQATGGYHLKGHFGEVHDNEYPYRLKASYLTGLFYESSVDASGAPGDSEISVEDATYFRRGRECYFDTDAVNEKSVDRRFITDVDYDNNLVSFRPAIKAIVPIGSLLRMVDKNVRAACGEIITDLLTYPANTKTFIKNLSKFDIQKQWVRTTDAPVPANAADKLDAYRLV